MQRKAVRKFKWRTKADLRKYLQQVKAETGSMYSPNYHPTGETPTQFLQKRGLLPAPPWEPEFDRRWILCGAPGLRQIR